MKKIILASSSPRRIQMMKEHGFKAETAPAHIDETLPFPMSAEASAMYLAFKKADHVCSAASDSDSIIIAADTIVVFQNNIIGKPTDPDAAFSSLREMKNTFHYVITGVCILEKSMDHIISKTCLYEKTTVYFDNYSDEELRAYVNTDEPYDKAGGYAIQGTFSKYIHHIDGDYDNVVGFPWKAIEPYLI